MNKKRIRKFLEKIFMIMILVGLFGGTAEAMRRRSDSVHYSLERDSQSDEPAPPSFEELLGMRNQVEAEEEEFYRELSSLQQLLSRFASFEEAIAALQRDNADRVIRDKNMLRVILAALRQKQAEGAEGQNFEDLGSNIDGATNEALKKVEELALKGDDFIQEARERRMTRWQRWRRRLPCILQGLGWLYAASVALEIDMWNLVDWLWPQTEWPV